jgi:D-tyrosyl-tRNA(Tyr) deacylase
VQRVKRASVAVGGRPVSGIEKGLLLLVGIGRDDSGDDISRAATKIASMRIFEDPGGKMNLDVRQARGSVLSVPQFTLYADTRKGNRPGFSGSAPPDEARRLWKDFGDKLRAEGLEVKEGAFGEHMEVELVNDGPVTIWLDPGAGR